MPDQRQPADPAGIELQLLAGLAVGDGIVGAVWPNSQLDDGKPMQRGIRQVDALAGQQLANLRQPQAVCRASRDRVLLRATPSPVVASRPPAAGMQRQQHVAELLSLTASSPTRSPVPSATVTIPPDRFRIEPQRAAMRFFGTPARQRRRYFGDFDHRDLAIHPGLLPGRKARDRRPLSRGQARGERF